MKEETKRTLRQLQIALMITIVIFFSAAFILSFYSGIDMTTAFGTVFLQVLSVGTGGILGNVLYLMLIFMSLALTLYIIENVIILLSQLRFGGMVMGAKISSLKDHYIVCGAGRVGMHVAEKLKSQKKKVAIIEVDKLTVDCLKNKGYAVIHGDCGDEDVLIKAKIKNAEGLVACTGEDSRNVFLVLTAKDLNPSIKVATRVNDLKAKAEFERAGADIIVAPEITGGYELADKISNI